VPHVASPVPVETPLQPQRIEELLQQILENQRHIKEQQARQAARLEHIEKAQSLTITKEAYTVEEAAERVGKKPFTVRQWCNNGQFQAKKVPGSGRTGEWRVAPEEVARYHREGLKPREHFDNHGRVSRRVA